MINDEKLQEEINFDPFHQQETIIQNFKQKRDLRIVAGRRGGKSMIAAYLALKTLLQKDKRIWVVAPTYQLTKKVFNYVVKWAKKGFPETPWEFKTRPFPRIDTKWDSWLEGKSTTKTEGLIGEELDLVIVDEAARIPYEAWTNSIYPCLSSRQGKSMWIGTPRGRNHFYDEYMLAKKRHDAEGFRYASSENPHLEEEELERAKEQLPQDIFRQEYLAKFLKGAATVFAPDDLDEVKNDNALADYKDGHLYSMGVDLAKHEDATVITVMDNHSNRVCYIEKIEKMHYPYQKKRIKAIAKRYGDARITVDSTGVGEPVFDDLLDEGLVVDDFKFTNTSKRKLIDKLRIIIEEHNLVIPPNDELEDQLLSFSYELTKTGKRRYSAPQGMMDDYVDSLALACWSLDTKPEERITAFEKQVKEGQKYKKKRRNKFV